MTPRVRRGLGIILLGGAMYLVALVLVLMLHDLGWVLIEAVISFGALLGVIVGLVGLVYTAIALIRGR